MKELILTPGKQAALYFIGVGILCLLAFYVFPNNFKSFITMNFCIYGMLATFFIARGIGAIRKGIKIFKNVHFDKK